MLAGGLRRWLKGIPSRKPENRAYHCTTGFAAESAAAGCAAGCGIPSRKPETGLFVEKITTRRVKKKKTIFLPALLSCKFFAISRAVQERSLQLCLAELAGCATMLERERRSAACRVRAMHRVLRRSRFAHCRIAPVGTTLELHRQHRENVQNPRKYRQKCGERFHSISH